MGEAENKVRNEVRIALKKMGWFVYHVKQKGVGCYAGISDYIAIRKSRTVHVETKTDDGKQNDAQVKFERDVKEHGGEYIVARGIDDLMAARMLT